VPAIEPGQDREHSTFRFNITRIMESLAEQSGDLDELVAVKAHDLSSAYHFVEIADLEACERLQPWQRGRGD
jgi:hypothetical protein